MEYQGLSAVRIRLDEVMLRASVVFAFIFTFTTPVPQYSVNI
jgi:hypothetical protein